MIPVTKLHILRLMLQLEQNISGLQRDVRNNALAWQAAAQAQSVPLATLAGWITQAAATYAERLGWVSALQSNADVWHLIDDMWAFLGGTAQEFAEVIDPLAAATQQLSAGDLSSYEAVAALCASITAAVNAPLSLWPE